MMLNFKTVFFVLLVGSIRYGESLTEYASSECRESLDSCATKTLTGGKCRTLSNGINLDLFRRDKTFDCMINSDEIAFDTVVNYDINGDDAGCKYEWNERRTIYNGFTFEFTDWEWRNKIVHSNDTDCVIISQLPEEPEVHVEEYRNTEISNLIEFCKLGDNARVNRDCAGLATVCKVELKGRPPCREFEHDSILTLSEKLQSLESDFNVYGERIVSGRNETLQHFKNLYDVDGNGCIDEAEWRNRLTDNLHQFSKQFANYRFVRFQYENNWCIQADSILDDIIPGFPVYSYTVSYNLMEALIDMCESKPSLYDTNTDCAQVYDACNNDFDSLDKCKPFLNDCGFRAYSRCIFLAGQFHCQDDDSRTEVDIETFRVENYFKPGCTPLYDLDVNGGFVTGVSYVGALVLGLSTLLMIML